MTISSPVQRELNFRQRELRNGLTVIVEERRAVPVVALNIWYGVGSRHESADQRGLAHLFEHLMFQGSAHVAAGEYDTVLEAVGARYNATTSFDRTNYFVTVPVHALATALWLEADRMATLPDALSQEAFEAQRDVVKNERLQTMVEVPYGEWLQHQMAQLFPPSHPYAVTPIGEMAHLDAATLDDLRAFFDRHYAPQNAVLSIVGDVDTEEAFALAEKYFAGITARSLVEHADVTALPPVAPDQGATIIDAEVPYPAVFRGWRAPAMTDDSFAALELVALVLGGGTDGRLRRVLMRDLQLALDVEADVIELAAGNSVFFINTFLPDGVDADDVVRVVDDQLLLLIEHGITENELATAVAHKERAVIESMAAVDGRSDMLSQARTIFGDAGRADELVDRFRSVRPEDVVDAAATWLRPDACTTVIYRPAEPDQKESLS
ncbi:M16 family metallopeptidase [Microbacterium natoriense]